MAIGSLTLSEARTWLLPRDSDVHKGSFGHVLVLGGHASGFEGAGFLASEAALRSGAGCVSLAAAKSGFISTRPELMVYRISSGFELRTLLSRATVMVIGPGLGQTAKVKTLWQIALEMTGFMVVDADALNLLALEPKKQNNWILTPHPGEAARLLKTTVSEIQSDRLGAATEIVAQYGGIVILKGAGTLIVDAINPPIICAKSVPAMATAGMGDVLAGLLGGLLAQKMSLWHAACLGVIVHAEAAEQFGLERGLLASDLFPAIVKLLN